MAGDRLTHLDLGTAAGRSTDAGPPGARGPSPRSGPDRAGMRQPSASRTDGRIPAPALSTDRTRFWYISSARKRHRRGDQLDQRHQYPRRSVAKAAAWSVLSVARQKRRRLRRTYQVDSSSMNASVRRTKVITSKRSMPSVATLDEPV